MVTVFDNLNGRSRGFHCFFLFNDFILLEKMSHSKIILIKQINCELHLVLLMISRRKYLRILL